jgi:predicted Holliday junction resolvase-like endonuclease
MTELLPTASIWEQFAVIAVMVLVVALLGYGAVKVFREFTKWQTEQNVQREKDQETQRQWEESREAKLDREMRERNQTWQEFFKRINDDNVEAIKQMTVVYGKLVEQIDCVLQGMQSINEKVSSHDQFARQGLDELKKAHSARNKRVV